MSPGILLRPKSCLARALSRIRILLVALAAMAAVAALGFSDSLCTGRELTAAQVQALFPNKTFVDSDHYAVVNSDCLQVLQDIFISALYRNGLKPEWSPRFACGKFSLVYLSTARLTYLSHHVHDANLPPLALGEVWYMTGPKSAHAIVVAITERGVVYWDPQCGQEVTMSADLLAGTMMRKF